MEPLTEPSLNGTIHRTIHSKNPNHGTILGGVEVEPLVLFVEPSASTPTDREPHSLITPGPLPEHTRPTSMMQPPASVVDFFMGAGGVNVMVSPTLLTQHTGLPRVYLPAYDIYHGGKGSSGETVYTRYRILGKESVHNTIQGVLEVRIVEGYGAKEDGDDRAGSSGVCEFLRPNDIKKRMTEGTTSIKRNSVIILRSGLLVRLEDVENFCDLPIIERTRLFKSQTHVAISKRETYKMVRGTDNWAHVKRGALARDMERSVHKLLLPYYRKYRTEGDKDFFFRTFMEDLLVVCNAHHSNFTGGGDFRDVVEGTMSKRKQRSGPHLLNETRPRKKWGGIPPRDKDKPPGSVERKAGPPGESDPRETRDQVKKALKNVSKSKIASLVF
jgi:hypothetical protein